MGFTDQVKERAARDEALERVERHGALAEAARQAALAVLKRDHDVDSTRARELLLQGYGLDFAEPRAWGPVMRRLATELSLRRLRWRQGGSHARPVAVWGK